MRMPMDNRIVVLAAGATCILLPRAVALLPGAAGQEMPRAGDENGTGRDLQLTHQEHTLQVVHQLRSSFQTEPPLGWGEQGFRAVGDGSEWGGTAGPAVIAWPLCVRPSCAMAIVWLELGSLAAPRRICSARVV